MTTETNDATSANALGLVLVVRNEERFLRDHLAYHRRLGVNRCYVFLDRCTDGTEAIARSHSWVEVLHRDRPRDVQFMSRHQKQCLREAMSFARNEGLRWLMHLDPDEFARGDDPYRGLQFLQRERSVERTLPSARLSTLLDNVPQDITQVILRPLDAIPTPHTNGAAFHQIQHFQNRGAITRRILDPAGGKVHHYKKRLGHYKGKALVRVAAGVEPGSAHHWQRIDGSPLPTLHRGLHYHYVVVDGAQWYEKHRKFAEYPAHWEKGTPVRFPKQAWKQAASQMTPEEANAYFDQWIAVEEKQLRWPLRTGAIVRDDFVTQVLALKTSP